MDSMRLIVAIAMTLTVAGCGPGVTSPTPPTTAPPAQPVVLTPPHSLSGVVFEVTAAGARVPIPGVEIEEYANHTLATTDASGFYRHALPSGGMTYFGFEMAGFQSSRNQTFVNGDTRFDIQVFRR